MDLEGGQQTEIAVDSTVALVLAPAIKGEDLTSFLEKFTQMLVGVITAKPHANTSHNYLMGKLNCHFCGEKGHILPCCKLVQQCIDERKICHIRKVTLCFHQEPTFQGAFLEDGCWSESMNGTGGILDRSLKDSARHGFANPCRYLGMGMG